MGYKTQILNNHFKYHGRQGLEADIEVDIEEVKKLKTQLEDDIKDIRENQRRKKREDPMLEKKIPARENGMPFQEWRYLETRNNPAPPLTDQNSNDVSNNHVGTNTVNSTQGYINNGTENNLVQKENMFFLPNEVDRNPPNQIDVQCYNDVFVPNDLKELPLDKLLNNDF